jgi:hypothetical protein
MHGPSKGKRGRTVGVAPLPGSMPLPWWLPEKRVESAPTPAGPDPAPGPDPPRGLPWSELQGWRWGPALLPEGHPDLEADEPLNVLQGEPAPELPEGVTLDQWLDWLRAGGDPRPGAFPQNSESK